MLCQALGNGQPPQGAINYQQRPRGRRGRGQQRGGNNGGRDGYGGGGYNGNGAHYNGGNQQTTNGGSGGYNGGNQNAQNGGGGYNGGGGTNGGGDPPTPIKRFENWNYCSTHGGDVDNYHTSATCSRPGENHQRTATRTNTMGGSMRGMHKTILPSAAGRQAPTPRPPPPPINYTPTHFQAWNNGPRLPMTPGSWGFGPHAAAYQ